MTTASTLKIALNEARAIVDMQSDHLKICREVRDDWHAQCDDLLTEIERLKDQIANDVIFKALREEIERLREQARLRELDFNIEFCGHHITEAQIDAAEKHILTSSLEWIRAFAYGVLFELGLLDESGVSVLARSVDGESGLPNTAKVGRVQPDESEAASRHFITDAQIDAAWRYANASKNATAAFASELALKELGIERCPSGKGWIKT